MNNKLIGYIKKMSGVTLGIGIDNDKLKDELNKNNDINICYLLEENNKIFGKKKFSFNKKLKTVNIKKIKSVFKKKRIVNLICNYKTISPFLRTFVKDSVFINSDKLYIYGTGDYDKILNSYKRYTDDIEVINNKDGFIIIVNNKNTKNGFFKDFYYSFLYIMANILDFLTVLLSN